MKKLERLRWIEATFGSDVVAPYRACYTWIQIEEALRWLWHQLGDSTPGIRTDTHGGSEQGLHLPFLFPVRDLHDPRALWQTYGTKLIYIVSAGVQPVLCNGVAVRVGPEHMLVEINGKEPLGTQRGMYEHPENLQHFAVGPGSRCVWQGRLITCYNPDICTDLSLDRIYRAMFTSEAEELTFSVRSDRRVVIW